MIKLPVIDDTVAGKKVLVRGDIDVPLKDGQIVDDTRLKDIKPTIDLLLKNKCQVILCGHLGRPASADATARQSLSTKPIQEYFPQVKVLENLRFDPREEANDESFSKELASQADIFVNESFAECYRDAASLSVAKLLPHFAGLRLAKEVEMLSKLTENPARPMVVIIGGAKIDSKLPVINKMAEFADNVVIGGKLVTEYQPVDNPKVKVLSQIFDGKDCTLESIAGIEPLLSAAKTVVWNGPLGLIEDYTYQVGSRRLAEVVTSNTDAYKVLGGGDTVGFVDKIGLTGKFSWVSSGGSSMLHFLAGDKLPGIELLI